MLDLKKAFAAASEAGEYIKFERVENKLHPRPDLCAFLLLDKLAPLGNEGHDMVCAAEHDVIYLGVDLEQLAANATQDDIVTLARCGVRYCSEGLEMFT